MACIFATNSVTNTKATVCIKEEKMIYMEEQ